jgi:hypothetical protein
MPGREGLLDLQHHRIEHQTDDQASWFETARCASHLEGLTSCHV